ncbi:desmin-like [Polymixia lowei]
MSRSISSYRRQFDDGGSSLFRVRVSSPSPTRQDVRYRSASYGGAANSMHAGRVGRTTVSSSRKLPISATNSGAISVVFGKEAPINLDAATAENQVFLSTRSSERQEMIILNDRLVAYIEKVRSLEQKNMLLESEIEAIQSRFVKPTGLRMLYEEQLKELKSTADQARVRRDLAVAAKEVKAGQLEAIKIKYEEEVQQRKQAEMDLEAFYPIVDKATSTRIALEKQLEQLEVELEFLQRVQKQEIEELMKQIYATLATAQSAFALPDLSSALKQIQSQYDDIAAKNLQEMDAWYGSKFEDLNNKASKNIDNIRSVREQINSAKKDIQSKECDLDNLKTENDALEAQLRETQEVYKKELEDLRSRIEALQIELKSTKEKSAKLLREYQQLLNVKMALEMEITTYRKLIEGEDSRFSCMVKQLCGNTLDALGGSMSVGVTGGNAGGTARRMTEGLDSGCAEGHGGEDCSVNNGNDKGRNSPGTNGPRQNGVGSKGHGTEGNATGIKNTLANNASSNGLERNGARGNCVNGASLSIHSGMSEGDNGKATNNTNKQHKQTASGSTYGSTRKGGGTIDFCTGGQTVEVTERKTVLIRTVKMEKDVLERPSL